MAEKKEWISTTEAAELLGVTTARIRQLVASEEVAAQKVGSKYRGQWLIKTSSITKRLSKLLDKGESLMRVRSRMTPDPIVTSPKATYNEVLHLMKSNGIKHLPVVSKKGELVGIITHSDMLEAEPSPVTTLSIYEMASLLEKVTASQIMRKPVYTVEDTCSITNAAKFMLEKGIGSLPVLREGEIVGIITDSDVMKTFVEITGGEKVGTRVEVKTPNKKGELAKLSKAFANANSYIASMAITYSDDNQICFMDIKEHGADMDRLSAEIAELEGIDILDISASDEDCLCVHK